jgi:hypothetical protein
MKRSNSSWVRLFVIATMAVICWRWRVRRRMVVGAGLGLVPVSSPACRAAGVSEVHHARGSGQASLHPGAEAGPGAGPGLFDEAMNLIEDQFYGDLPADEDVT